MTLSIPDPESIAEAVRRLCAGQPIAFPTETVYGLGADATDHDAIARVFEIKGRPSTNPLIVHVSSIEMARQVVAEWTEAASKLATQFWPGPLSLVLPKAKCVPDLVTAGGPTVAVRMPRHPMTLALLEAFGKPLVGPSANPSGSVSPTTAAHVRASWSQEEVYVLDGGPCTVGIESTVLGLPPTHTDPPQILRPGAINADELSGCLGCRVEPFKSTYSHGPSAPTPSPGLHKAHYQPKAPMVLNPVDSVQGEAVIHLPTNPQLAGELLYAELRAADAQAPTRIVVRVDSAAPESDPLWAAIFDRLDRASASS